MSGFMQDTGGEDELGLSRQRTGAAGSTSASEVEVSTADKLIAAEQQRTERQRVEQVQRQLRLETVGRGRGYGLRALFGALGAGRGTLLGAG